MKLSLLLLMSIYMACSSLIYWFVVSTYLTLRSDCLSDFFSNEIILNIANGLLFDNATVSSFHKRPTTYLLFSFFVVFTSMLRALFSPFGSTLVSFFLSVPYHSFSQNLRTRFSRCDLIWYGWEIFRFCFLQIGTNVVFLT